ncbi:MAG: response regulator [Puia sp.]|nr:response regulator [Puia sp.]
MKKKLNCILLVDDDRATNFLHSAIVEDTGLTDSIATAESGDRALGYLALCEETRDTVAARPIPELIFLDINMPGMSGWEFLREYDKLLKTQVDKSIMVMLTASPNPDDESMAMSFPLVKEYRRKPLTTDMLEDIVGQYFP